MELLNFTISCEGIPYKVYEWIATEASKEREVSFVPGAFIIKRISSDEIGKIRNFVRLKWGVSLSIKGRVAEAKDIFE